MDLLTGYGSDASDDEEAIEKLAELGSGRGVAASGARGATSAAPHPSPRVPQPPTTVPGPNSDALQTDGISGAGTGSSGSLWSRLPPPSASGTGLSGLPPPTSGGAGGGGSSATATRPAAGGSKKVVTLQLPFRKELLAAALDSDDDEEPAAKRVKTGRGKSRLMDFLPPPKHDTRAALPALGAGPPKATAAAGGKPAAGPVAAAGPAAAGTGAGAGSLPADFFAAGNEAYRIRDDQDDGTESAAAAGTLPPEAYPAGGPPYPPYGQPPYGSYPSYAAYDYAGPGPGPGPGYGPPAAAPPPGGGGGGGARQRSGSAEPLGPDELLAEALRAEQERAGKRGGGGAGGVKMVEIKAADLTKMDPAAREAANSARDALGPEYALSLRRSAAPFEGSKLARRKHQIGTLLFNARMQELEQMEKRTQGQKSKAETAAKYGW